MNYSIEENIIGDLAIIQNTDEKLGFFALMRYRVRYYWNLMWDIIDVKISQRQFRAGKGRVLHSFADLDNLD